MKRNQLQDKLNKLVVTSEREEEEDHSRVRDTNYCTVYRINKRQG